MERLLTITVASGWDEAGLILRTGKTPSELEADLRPGGLPVRVQAIPGALADCAERAGLIEPGDLAVCVWIGEMLQAGASAGAATSGRWPLDPEIEVSPAGGLNDLRARLLDAKLETVADPCAWPETIWSSAPFEAWAAALGGWLALAGARGASPRIADNMQYYE